MEFILEQIKSARIKLAEKRFIEADKQLSAIDTYIEENNSVPIEPPVINRLYDVVTEYVESKGGKLVVIGGVQIIQMPDDKEFNFTIGVRCTGRKPTYAL